MRFLPAGVFLRPDALRLLLPLPPQKEALRVAAVSLQQFALALSAVDGSAHGGQRSTALSFSQMLMSVRTRTYPQGASQAVISFAPWG
jgi:hypothetical protein